MKPKVLALDYDGTIAIDGALDPTVREAIAEARGRNLDVLLVTGRILADLERHLDDLSIFHAVVAENGAVLHFPSSRRSVLLAPPPKADFLDELRRRDVPFLAGQCVVETDAHHAAAVLEVIRETELPLVLQFNRGRLMILPQAVSKATGLREALRALRLSTHDTVGIGDGENDHQLLTVCEIGAAVAWGSRALIATADEVVPGDGPPAVAEYVRALLREPRIGPERLGRRRLHLGVGEGGAPFELALRGRNALITGDTQSGKSWVAGVLCEQLVLDHYCVCVIDPEGEYGTLESLPSVIVFDPDSPPALVEVERALRYPDVSTVIDLSCLSLETKRTYVRSLLAHLRDLRRRTGLPHRIVLDEAHYFLHDPEVTRLLDLSLGGHTFVTWHASQLAPDVLASADAIVATRVSDPEEARALHALRGGDVDRHAWATALGGLENEWAALLPGAEESGEQLLRFRVSARLTAHVRHLHKYLNLHVPAGRAFVFRGSSDGGPTTAVSTLGELLSFLASAPDLDRHLRRHDLSRWILDVFEDRALGHRVLQLEERYEAGALPRPHRALIAAVRGRLGGRECGDEGAVAAAP